MRKLLSVFALLFFLQMIALTSGLSDGLEILNQSFQVNKTVGQPVAITFSVRNNEPFDFYNITFEANPDVTMQKIDQLASGATISVSASIVTNETLDKTFRLRGFYETSIGASDKTFAVNVTPFESNPCDLSITEGDSVAWTSKLQSQILMLNADSGLPVDGATLNFNQTFTKQFTTAQTFKYTFSVSGISFPQTCTLTVLPGSGLVNNPDFDALLALKVNQNFPPTVVEAVVPETSYSMEFFQTADGSLTVFNRGGSVAKNVKLESDWLNFNKNNFDIQPGQSVGVAFTILPKVGSTAETNRSYNKTLTISGNFPTVTSPMNIFIQYAVINGNLSDFQNTSNLIDLICRVRPDLCAPQIVYRTTNNVSGGANISITQSNYEALMLAVLEETESRQNLDKVVAENIYDIAQSNNETRMRADNLSAEVEKLRVLNEDNHRNLLLTVICVLLVASCALGGYLVIYLRRKKALEAFENH